jgi:hypothetical protein
VLRSNNGGGYIFKEFDTFAREARIKRELIVPYNLQHNWVAKRKSRAIIETAKAMIHDLVPCTYLWVEACCMIVYTMNMCLHRILKDNTLEEAITGKKPHTSYFCVSVVLCILIFLRRKVPSWNPLI